MRERENERKKMDSMWLSSYNKCDAVNLGSLSIKHSYKKKNTLCSLNALDLKKVVSSKLCIRIYLHILQLYRKRNNSFYSSLLFHINFYIYKILRRFLLYSIIRKKLIDEGIFFYEKIVNKIISLKCIGIIIDTRRPDENRPP